MRVFLHSGQEKRRRIFAASIAALGLALAPAQALATALGSSALGELTGSRNVAAGGGLQGLNEWDNGLFTVAWEVTLGSGGAHYKYTFTGLSGKDISNIVLDLTDDCGGDPYCAENAMINGSTIGVVTEFGDFAGITGGLKIEGVDEWGIPTLRFNVTWSDHEVAQIRHFQETAHGLLEALGAEPLWDMPGPESDYGITQPGQIIHEVGTARMGNDPSTSVLDPMCRAHDVPNLYVADAASFVSQAEKNPTWTILALSMRTAEHIADEALRLNL